MKEIEILKSSFDKEGFWKKELTETNILLDVDCTSLFDQNGYHLTAVERAYAEASSYDLSLRREDWVIHKPWMRWDKHYGAHFNHCELFERKGFSDGALEQLNNYAVSNPMLWKVINMKPKWGIDVSIDFVDKSGRVFEVFHYEWDGFDYEMVYIKKEIIENFIISKNWDEEAEVLWKLRNEWINLNFFEQSEWKTNYYGLDPENFKNIIWTTS
tara:strand:- start:1672 stop:2313 length:642 start_codon:yes stop_codon:yes gene_type:complete